MKQLRDIHLQAIGFTLYYDKEFLKTSYRDEAISFYEFYQEIFGRCNDFEFISSERTPDKISYFYSIECLECIESLDNIDFFYDPGVRSVGFTWDYDNYYATARASKGKGGSTAKGKELVRKKLNGKRAIIDIAHLGESSVKDTHQIYEGTMVTIHSNVRKI